MLIEERFKIKIALESYPNMSENTAWQSALTKLNSRSRVTVKRKEGNKAHVKC